MNAPVPDDPVQSIAPCPFCGSTSITIGYLGQPAQKVYMVCLHCKAQGPSQDYVRTGRMELATDWNTRSRYESS